MLSLTACTAEPSAGERGAQAVPSGRSRPSHHGGRLAIGPDGNLWIGTGDAFEPSNAAATNSLNGKILRIRPGEGCANQHPGLGCLAITNMFATIAL